MSHKDTLNLLFPVKLEGEFSRDTELEGKHLDSAQTRAEDLLKEFYADSAFELLGDWERVCGLFPAEDEPIQSRRDNVIRKLREHGSLSIDFFIALVAKMGYTITIEELKPFMAGIGRCGDTLYVEAIRWVWRVKIAGQSLYYFRAGQSGAGEKLLWWPVQAALENILNELKPAHTYIIFDYS